MLVCFPTGLGICRRIGVWARHAPVSGVPSTYCGPSGLRSYRWRYGVEYNGRMYIEEPKKKGEKRREDIYITPVHARHCFYCMCIVIQLGWHGSGLVRPGPTGK